VYAGTDPLTHRPRYIRETAKTCAEAEVALTRLQRQVDEDAHPRSVLTIGEAVAQWLAMGAVEMAWRNLSMWHLPGRERRPAEAQYPDS
jgi:hypothetical protein